MNADEPRQNPRGHGGPRPGSGRKPKALTVKKRELAEEMAESAERAFRLVAKLMDDPKQPMALRFQAAQEILNRSWGRPKQALTVGVEPFRDVGMRVDREAQLRMLADPELRRLAADMDTRMMETMKAPALAIADSRTGT